ncbi:Primosomal protein N' (replication factor Y) - superfamily II helicase [Candidatus Rhodobacter oscarellae]|uniref:Primosomal protein N' (Replication factor Y)-superfamily II helicase n=1 Tax=Candidatus Rhodobacter oscarellae TaxID=1675527 RepID=A0A0J9E4A3_9RHOB|nr:hypothetical protein [Candidatus Rhodobacter lobularis]KMW57557.1 Primosomal protein N' (replication factor Y) - superfamily II helicase [Candidatus Rhodobacter lobularis]
MEPLGAQQRGLLCPSCGGQCAYDPAARGLKCESCGTVQSLKTPSDDQAAKEFPFDADAPAEEAPAFRGSQVHHCQTCGGDVVFTGPALSERCPYCNGPVVLGTEDLGYETTALVPFRVPEADAQAYALDWVRRRIAAPSDLARTVSKGRVAGLYAPFWTFDSQEAVQYWASYTVGSGKNRRRRSVSGKMSITFDDLLMPASPHVTPLIRDGILHEFHPERLRPYGAGYLAGFAAERHHQSVAEGLEANRTDKRLLIRNRIKCHVGRPGTKVGRFRTDTSGIHYRRILLPVWILHYAYGGKGMKVVVSGIDGRTFGERPFSYWKLAGLSALASAAALAFGMVWGAAGFL